MFVKENSFYLGKISRTHGIHGQLVLMSSILLDLEDTEEPILVDIDGGLVPFYLRNKKGIRDRDHQSYIIHFDHLNTKDEAERYTGCDAYLLEAPQVDIEATEIPDALFNGFTIYTKDDKQIGNIEEVVDYSGNTLARVLIDEKEILLPFGENQIINIDPKARTVHLEIPEGLLEI